MWSVEYLRLHLVRIHPLPLSFFVYFVFLNIIIVLVSDAMYEHAVVPKCLKCLLIYEPESFLFRFGPAMFVIFQERFMKSIGE